MKNRQYISLASALALLFFVLLLLKEAPLPEPGDGVDSDAGEQARPSVVGLNSPAPKDPEPPSLPADAWADSTDIKYLPRTAEQDAMDAAIREQLAWMEGQRAAGPPAVLPEMKPIVRREIPEELLPKHAPLEPGQVAALGELRWQTAGKFVDYRTSAENPTISYLRGRQLERAAVEAEPGRSLAETTARSFLRRNDALLLLEETDANLVLRSETTDELGYTHLRFATSYEGLPVWPSELTVQTGPDGHVSLLTGAYAPHPEGLDTDPAVPAAVARATAKRATGADLLAPVAAESLQVFAPVDRPDPRLAWRFEMHSSMAEHWEVFVDANSGELLHKSNSVCTAHAAGSGVDLAGNTRPINLWQHTDGGYYMTDTTKPMFNPGASQPPNPQQVTGGITILRAPNPVIEGGKLKGLGDILLSGSGSPTSGFSPAAVAASYNLSAVYDYYLNRFGRNSIDGEGGSLLAIVDITGFQNAFWQPAASLMAFGTAIDYAQALDVTAHEMTHGVVSSTSDLVYEHQSGALNESFADILGEGCEAHVRGSLTDWTLGDILPRPFHRSLSDPGSLIEGATGLPFPARMSEFRDLPTETDAGGVHVNSSIQNHAFYLLAAGLPGAIGLDDALAIFYRAVTTKLNPNSQFIDSRLGCVTSAEELFGVGSVQAVRTGQAFDAVEIYDQGGTPAETPIPTVNAPDSTLFIFPSGGQMFLGRREAAFGDGAAGVFLGDNGVGTPVAPGKKPVVVGDGSHAVYITPSFDAAFINTTTGEERFLGYTGQIESVSLAADGSLMAFVLREGGQPSKKLLLYNPANEASVVIEATQPVTDDPGDGIEDKILFLDALDLSPDGRFVYYDALSRTIFPGGFFLDTWSTYYVDLGAARIFSLFPPIPGVSIGNPSIGQTRTNLLTFDVQDQSGAYWVYATNRDDGQIKPVALLSGGSPVAPGWPGYSGDDSAVVYTDYYFDNSIFQWIPVLATIPIATDGITPTGPNVAWLQGSSPNIGTLYRRGGWQGLPTVSAARIADAQEGGSEGCVRLSRDRADNTPLTVRFTLIGDARNGIDYAALPLTATIPAGATSVDVMIDPIDDSEQEGGEQVSLTLSKAIDYRAGSPATVAIGDNDSAPSGFAAWASANGIAANDYGGNRDGDPWNHLEEYALGLDPATPEGEDAVSVRISGGRMVIDVQRVRRADINYAVETSVDGRAGTWTTGGTTTLSDTDTLLSVRHNAPLEGRRLARLRVTKL